MAEFMKIKLIEIARAMGAKTSEASPASSYDSQSAPATHVHGGTIMSPSPDQGVVNPYLQHWQIPNLFVLGPSSFPQQNSDGPTLTIIALAIRTSDAIVNRYIKKPDFLM
jgi:gluconate 2-dehydrogenase alpha chain